MVAMSGAKVGRGEGEGKEKSVLRVACCVIRFDAIKPIARNTPHHIPGVEVLKPAKDK
jgi:hypothetical protein